MCEAEIPNIWRSSMGGPGGSVIPTLDDPCVAYIKSMISTKKVLIIISKISLTSKETVKVNSNRR